MQQSWSPLTAKRTTSSKRSSSCSMTLSNPGAVIFSSASTSCFSWCQIQPQSPGPINWSCLECEARGALADMVRYHWQCLWRQLQRRANRNDWLGTCFVLPRRTPAPRSRPDDIFGVHWTKKPSSLQRMRVLTSSRNCFKTSSIRVGHLQP